MKYSQLSVHTWTPEFRSLSNEATRLWLHLKANPLRNSEGLFRWPPGYAKADTGLDQSAYEKARAELVAAGMISYDPSTEVVLDRDSLTIRRPTGWPQLRGALRALDGVPDTPLLEELLELAREHAPDFAALLVGEYEHDVKDLQTGEITRVREPGHPRLKSTVSIPYRDTIDTPSIPPSGVEWSGEGAEHREGDETEKERSDAFRQRDGSGSSSSVSDSKPNFADDTAHCGHPAPCWACEAPSGRGAYAHGDAP